MTDESSATSGQPVQPADRSATRPLGPPIAVGSQVVVVVSRGPAAAPQAALAAAPDVLGAPQGDAMAKLQAIGLTAEVLEDYSADVARARVMRQYPEPGRGATAGSSAALIISKGAAPDARPTAPLPDLIGMSESEALSQLQAVGLSAHVVREFSPTVPEGIVVAQVPNALSLAQAPAKRLSAWVWAAIAAAVVLLLLGGIWLVKQNQESSLTKIATVVATGTTEATSAAEATVPAAPVAPTTPATATAAVPNVIGKSQADAETALRNAGFVPVVAKLTTSQSPAGQVTAQLPGGGTHLQTGSEVGIEVAQAPAPAAPTTVKVPNVVGMTETNARSALSEAGLLSSFIAIANSAPKGTAIAQEPGSGVSVALGTVVVVEISSGTPPPPSTVAVPNVVGMTKSAAQSALSNAKLSSQAVDEFSETAPKGTVADQSPGAGSKVAPGTTVAIVISLGPKPTTPTNVTVPDLKGKTAEAAAQSLAELELLTEEVSVPSTSAPAGEVVGQMPVAGMHVPQGSTVVIDVAAELVATPY